MTPRLCRLVSVWLVGAAVGYPVLATHLEWQTIAARSRVDAEPTASSRHVDRERMMGVVRTLASPEYEGRKTGTRGGLKARRFIVERFREIGLDPGLESGYEQPFELVYRGTSRLSAHSRRAETPYENAANVIGRLSPVGAERRTIVVSAHYDHVGRRDGVLYPGADDNASGVAVLLELARSFVASPPRHPMLFVAFDGEELDLAGAKAFMNNPPVARERIALNVNLDMVSRNDRHEIFAVGVHHTPWLEPILRDVQRRSRVKVLLGHDQPTDRGGRADDWTDESDHKVFHDAGIPFLYFGVEDHADYHRPTDRADRIDARFFGDVGDMIVDALVSLDRALDSHDLR